MNNSFAQLGRYAIVGVATNLAGYLVYLLITHLGAPHKLTMTLLYGVGATLGYFGNRNLTFAHAGDLLTSGVRYCVAHGIGYLINLAILLVFVDHLGYPHQLMQAIAVFIVAGFLFITFKFFVFADPSIQGKDKS